MSSTPEEEDLADATEVGNETEEAAGSEAPAKLVRRRTKTGCLSKFPTKSNGTDGQVVKAIADIFLACRKRRIKCGEEKPVGSVF